MEAVSNDLFKKGLLEAQAQVDSQLIVEGDPSGPTTSSVREAPTPTKAPSRAPVPLYLDDHSNAGSESTSDNPNEYGATPHHASSTKVFRGKQKNTKSGY